MERQQRSTRLDELLPDPSEGRKTVYRIGDLARDFNVTLRTLRFYEDRGLISPERDGSTRLYSQRDRARLKVILLAKQVGFPLTEIENLLAIYDRYDDMEDADEVLVAKFTDQLQVLKQQKTEIEAAIERLETTIRTFSEL